MSRISQRFAELKSRGEKALVTYVAAGDPSLAESKEIIRTLAASGADLIELGLAFSDPVADGPVIQAGSQRALAAGANTDNVLAMVAELRAEGVTTPILIMTYYNLVFRPGLETFCRRAVEAGVDGLILPDVSLEESGEILAAATPAGLDVVQFVAPTSSTARIERAAKAANGFVYCVSLTGVTGARTELPTRFVQTVEEAKRHTDTPVCVGFGISTPEHVRQVASIADGVIVGSALVKLCGADMALADRLQAISQFVADLKQATKVAK